MTCRLLVWVLSAFQVFVKAVVGEGDIGEITLCARCLVLGPSVCSVADEATHLTNIHMRLWIGDSWTPLLG